MKYVVIFFLLALFELLYFKIAGKYKILDEPNHRSSHAHSTVRGGGIIFPIAILLAFLLGNVSWTVIWAVFIVATISFIDDIKPISQKPRFGSHIIAVLLIAHDLNLFQSPFWILLLVVVLYIGWVNAFNFMDGINGITVLYGLTAIISFSLLPINQSSLPMLIIMGLSCLVFGFFNLRTVAKTFAGDVGSISMALFLGYFMLKTIIGTGQLGFILFFSIYGIDAIITILYRIKRRENIFQAHRSHLYQYLVNEWGCSHILVSITYAFLQLSFNVLVIYLDSKGNLNLPVILILLAMMTGVYLVVRTVVVQKIPSIK